MRLGVGRGLVDQGSVWGTLSSMGDWSVRPPVCPYGAMDSYSTLCVTIQYLCICSVAQIVPSLGTGIPSGAPGPP